MDFRRVIWNTLCYIYGAFTSFYEAWKTWWWVHLHF